MLGCGAEAFAELGGNQGPGCFKLRDALVFKQVNDVVVVDSDGSDVVEHLMRVWVERPDGVAADVPWSATAARVACGMVLTTPFAMRSTTYLVSS
jgi:hypothetical protein